jgi:CSLREA domain-containing protein
VLVAVLGLLLAAPSALALTLHVDTVEDRSGGTCGVGPSCSLREALEVVNEGAGVAGDVTIDFSTTGTIELGVLGELELDPQAGVDSVSIVGPGTPSQLKIDAQEASRVLSIVKGDVAISGLTIERGAAGNGAGIRVEAGSLSIEETKIAHNDASGLGGGIYEAGSGTSVEILRSELDFNQAESGGAIYQDEGNLTVAEASLVAFNTVSKRGGGIDTDANGAHTTTIEDTEVLENKAELRGGGLYAFNGSGGVTVTDSTIAGNEAVEYGAGVASRGATTIRSSTISGNEVLQIEPGFERLGAGVAQEGGNLLLETVTIAGNENVGLYVAAGTATVRASTIAANTSVITESGGVVNEGTLKLRSTIVAANSGESGPADCEGTVTSEGHNIVAATGPGCTWAPAEGDQIDADPQLGPLADNGGPTATMAPTSRASIAINHGSNPAATDQRGKPRPVPAGPAFTDVGALEVQAPENETAPTVSPTANLELGDELTCTPGTWNTDTITDPTTSYAWLADGVPFATGATHVLTNADAGKQLVCQVTVDDGAKANLAFADPVELEAGVATLEPASLDFGPRNIGTGPGTAQSLTLSNDGVADVIVSAVASSDPTQFPIDASDCTAGGGVLHSGEECTASSRFSPTTTGPLSATVTVTTNVGAPTATLTGTGTAAVFSIFPASFQFDPTRVGSSLSQIFEISNSGSGPGTISGASVEGGDFSIPVGGDGCATDTLQPGDECTVEVIFTPTASGLRSGTLRIAGSAPTATAALTGTGTAAAFAAAPTSIDFGSRQIGDGAPTTLPVTISNPGTASAQLGPLAISGAGAGAFAIVEGSDNCSGQTLEPTENCALEIAFDPAAVGTFVANLSVPGQAPGTVPLRGVGVAAPLPPPPPPEPVPPVVPPRATLDGAPGTPHEADGAGDVSLPISCDSPAGTPCQVALAIRAAGGKGGTLGSWSGQVGAGETKDAVVRLSASARKTLGKSGRLRADVSLTTAGGEGSTEAVVLSPPPATILTVYSAKRKGNAILVSLACSGASTRCKGRLSLSVSGRSAPLAAGSLSLPRSARTARLPLSAAGRRLLESQPAPSLVAKATVSDPVYKRATTTTASLRLGS